MIKPEWHFRKSLMAAELELEWRGGTKAGGKTPFGKLLLVLGSKGGLEGGGLGQS